MQLNPFPLPCSGSPAAASPFPSRPPRRALQPLRLPQLFSQLLPPFRRPYSIPAWHFSRYRKSHRPPVWHVRERLSSLAQRFSVHRIWNRNSPYRLPTPSSNQIEKIPLRLSLQTSRRRNSTCSLLTCN